MGTVPEEATRTGMPYRAATVSSVAVSAGTTEATDIAATPWSPWSSRASRSRRRISFVGCLAAAGPCAAGRGDGPVLDEPERDVRVADVDREEHAWIIRAATRTNDGHRAGTDPTRAPAGAGPYPGACRCRTARRTIPAAARRIRSPDGAIVRPRAGQHTSRSPGEALVFHAAGMILLAAHRQGLDARMDRRPRAAGPNAQRCIAEGRTPARPARFACELLRPATYGVGYDRSVGSSPGKAARRAAPPTPRADEVGAHVASDPPAKFFVNQGVVTSRTDVQHLLRPILKQTVSYRYLRGREVVAHGRAGWSGRRRRARRVDVLHADRDHASTWTRSSTSSSRHAPTSCSSTPSSRVTSGWSSSSCRRTATTVTGRRCAAAARVRHQRVRPDGAPRPRGHRGVVEGRPAGGTGPRRRMERHRGSAPAGHEGAGDQPREDREQSHERDRAVLQVRRTRHEHRHRGAGRPDHVHGHGLHRLPEPDAS